MHVQRWAPHPLLQGLSSALNHQPLIMSEDPLQLTGMQLTVYMPAHMTHTYSCTSSLSRRKTLLHHCVRCLLVMQHWWGCSAQWIVRLRPAYAAVNGMAACITYQSQTQAAASEEGAAYGYGSLGWSWSQASCTCWNLDYTQRCCLSNLMSTTSLKNEFCLVSSLVVCVDRAGLLLCATRACCAFPTSLVE